jgi:AcrR family transcriptional regulator
MGITERKTRQKQALRERILDAARHIVVREGFAALSMRKIADAIEYSPATLYLYFESRDEIARALCAEGYAQLLGTFEPLARIADPAERLRGLARAYVAFGVAHPETYRLIFMEDPTYMGAALSHSADAGKAGGQGAGQTAVGTSAASEAVAGDTGAPVPASTTAATGDEALILINPAASDESGDAAMRMMVSALDELKAAGRLPKSVDGAVLAEAFWASMHGIVALNLTCPVFPSVPLDTLVDVTLSAWFGESPQIREATRVSAGASEASTPVAGERRTPRKPKRIDA